VAKIGPVKPVRKTTPFKAGSPVSAKPVRKGEVLKKKAAVSQKEALIFAAGKKQLVDKKNRQLVDMKKTIDKKTASTQMKKSQLEQMKKSVAKKPARKSLGGGTSRRASY
jgi:hypothetical protein